MVWKRVFVRRGGRRDIQGGGIAFFGPAGVIRRRGSFGERAIGGAEHRLTGQDIGQKAADSDDFSVLVDDAIGAVSKAGAQVFNAGFGDQIARSCGVQQADAMLQRHDRTTLSNKGEDRKLSGPTAEGCECAFGDKAIGFEALGAQAHPCGSSALFVMAHLDLQKLAQRPLVDLCDPSLWKICKGSRFWCQSNLHLGLSGDCVTVRLRTRTDIEQECPNDGRSHIPRVCLTVQGGLC